MKVKLEDRWLRIRLNPLEMLLTLHGSLNIPVDRITYVSAAKPQFDWQAVRAPGTQIPFLFRAGTYFTGIGREFWFALNGKRGLIVELSDWEYKRVVLTAGSPDRIVEKLSRTVPSTKS